MGGKARLVTGNDCDVGFYLGVFMEPSEPAKNRLKLLILVVTITTEHDPCRMWQCPIVYNFCTVKRCLKTLAVFKDYVIRYSRVNAGGERTLRIGGGTGVKGCATLVCSFSCNLLTSNCSTADSSIFS